MLEYIIYLPFIRLFWLFALALAISSVLPEHGHKLRTFTFSITGIILLIWAFCWPIGASYYSMHTTWAHIFGTHLTLWISKALFGIIGTFCIFIAFTLCMNDYSDLEDDYEI